MTNAERKLWHRNRNKQFSIKFKRQEPIGNYIVDFISYDKKIIIELDGSQHINNQNDKIKDSWFSKQGYIVLRFWDNYVLKNIESIIENIIEHISPST